MLASLGIAVLAALVAAPLARLLTDDAAVVDDMRALLLVLAAAIPGWAVAQASLGAMRGFGTMRSSVWVGAVVRPGVQLAVLAALVASGAPLWALGFAWLVAGLASAIAGLGWLRRRMAPIVDDAADDGRGEFWAHARPRAASDILHGALERLDVVLVGALAGSAAAGSYAAANRLVLAAQLLLVAIAQAIAPQVATRLAAGREADAEVVIQRVTGWSVLVMWPFLAVLVAGAPGIMQVFGDDFADTAPVVAVLGLGLAAVASLGPGDAVLLMTGDSRGSMHNHVASLVTMVVVALATIPTWGAMGAAVAWVVSRLVLRALSVWRIRRATGIRSVGPEVWIAGSLTVASYAPVAVAGRLFGTGAVTSSLLVAGLGSVAYVVGVWGLADRLEVARLLESVRRH